METTQAYLTGRQKYQRPQAVLFADNPGTKVNGVYIPSGYEVGAAAPENTDISLLDQFIILSDDNRAPLDFSTQRIESRQRMINGRMRSYHIADKLNLSLSWNMLPSRSYSSNPNFAVATASGTTAGRGTGYGTAGEHTSDGGAGGVELLDWYETHQGPFWVYLAYDKYSNFASDGADEKYGNLAKYNQIVEMYIADFSYSVQKRGGSNFDFWNVSIKLEEV